MLDTSCDTLRYAAICVTLHFVFCVTPIHSLLLYVVVLSHCTKLRIYVRRVTGGFTRLFSLVLVIPPLRHLHVQTRPFTHHVGGGGFAELHKRRQHTTSKERFFHIFPSHRKRSTAPNANGVKFCSFQHFATRFCCCFW